MEYHALYSKRPDDPVKCLTSFLRLLVGNLRGEDV